MDITFAMLLTVGSLSVPVIHRPSKRAPWMEAEVNALQAGVQLGTSSAEVRVTQVYVTVKTRSTMSQTLTYGYNGAGDVPSLGITPPTGSPINEAFAYDGQDRLAKWTASGGASYAHTYGYNAAGDRTSLNDGAAWTYTYGEDHRLTAYSKTGTSATVAYDANGTRDGGT